MRSLHRAVLPVLALAVAGLVLSSGGSAKGRVWTECLSTAHVHPRKCLMTGHRGEAAYGIPLEGLRWLEWGGLKARADGFEVGAESPRSRWPVKVVIYGRMVCDGKSVYRMLRLKAVQSGAVLRLRLLCTT